MKELATARRERIRTATRALLSARLRLAPACVPPVGTGAWRRACTAACRRASALSRRARCDASRLGLIVLAVDPDGEEDDAKQNECDHERRALRDADSQHEEPRVKAEGKRPEERLDAWIDRWKTK